MTTYAAALEQSKKSNNSSFLQEGLIRGNTLEERLAIWLLQSYGTPTGEVGVPYKFLPQLAESMRQGNAVAVASLMGVFYRMNGTTGYPFIRDGTVLGRIANECELEETAAALVDKANEFSDWYRMHSH
ncbi:hypothetical protein HYS48_02200 [Candidatus Woesearchaeota archaeon]|nr:hypothetical protein [Candidatus Woesearchaeota archaeon]